MLTVTLSFLLIHGWVGPLATLVALICLPVTASVLLFRYAQLIVLIFGPLFVVAGAALVAILVRTSLPAFPQEQARRS